MPEGETETRKILIRFFIYAIGVFVLFSAFIFMVNLQSSINIHNGIGTKGLALMYISAIGFGLLCVPVFIRKFGSKVSLIVSETAYLVYIVANYYPKSYIMLPASLLLGAAEATLWPCITMYNVYYGTEYARSRDHPTKTTEYFISRLSGYFFVIHHSTQVFGSLISIAIFSIYNTYTFTIANGYNITENNLTISANLTENFNGRLESYEHCGSNDCQRADVVDENIESYSPASRQKLIVLISCFALMCIIPQVVHVFMLPVVKAQKQPKFLLNDDGTLTTAKDLESHKFSVVKCGNSTNAKVEEDRSSCIVSEHDENILTTDHRREDSMLFHTLKQVGRQFLIPKQLLIMPISLYEGLLIGFVFSELPRSYVACVNGYTKIGYYTCLFGFGRVCLSFTISKKGKQFGRTRLYAIASILDIANLLFCLLWVPNINTSWSVYLVFLFYGFSDGIWEPLINIMYTEYFPDKHYIAGTLWAVMMHIGMGLQFAWSTSLCVYTKIYILLGMLVFGFVSYCVAERLNIRDVEKRQQKQDQRM